MTMKSVWYSRKTTDPKMLSIVQEASHHLRDTEQYKERRTKLILKAFFSSWCLKYWNLKISVSYASTGQDKSHELTKSEKTGRRALACSSGCTVGSNDLQLSCKSDESRLLKEAELLPIPPINCSSLHICIVFISLYICIFVLYLSSVPDEENVCSTAARISACFYTCCDPETCNISQHLELLIWLNEKKLTSSCKFHTKKMHNTRKHQTNLDYKTSETSYKINVWYSWKNAQVKKAKERVWSHHRLEQT